jgi:fumarate reductase flavoprotein subunit
MNENVTTADVLIVGAGIAGLIAANRLVQGGRRVVVLEQGADPAYPCNSRYSGGIFHICFRDPVGRTDEDLLDAIVEKTHGTAAPQLASAVAQDTRAVIAWLREQGVRFGKAGADEYKRWVLAPYPSNGYGLAWQGRGGDVTLRLLAGAFESRSGVLRRGERAVALDLAAPGGASVDAIAAAGPRRYRAQAVVIADGGFQGNPDLVREYITPHPEALLQRGAGTGRGDGLRMALAAGADCVGMKRFYGHVMHRDVLANEKLWPYPVLDPIVHSAIVVDGDGRRFVNEGEGGVWVANNIAWLPDPLRSVVVFDDAIWRGPAAQGLVAPNPNMIKAGGRLHSAATLAELAPLVGLPAAALERTVQEYNAAVVAGAPERLVPTRVGIFGKPNPVQPMPILQPPFHAVPLCCGLSYTMGGIRIDGNARVLDRNGAAIGRLYAVGGASGGLEGGPSGGYVGGLAKSGVTALRAAADILGRPGDSSAPAGS